MPVIIMIDYRPSPVWIVCEMDEQKELQDEHQHIVGAYFSV